MRNKLCLIVAFILIITALCACASNGKNETDDSGAASDTGVIPKTVQEFYVEFMETAKTDGSAFARYCHYESEEAQRQAEKGADLIKSYEIYRWGRYSDQLWCVEWFASTAMVPLGQGGVHYIGLINGEYKVILNIDHIPEELKAGCDIEEIEPFGPGIVDEDDIIR